MQKRTAVIGAGVSGLAAAMRLVRAGVEVFLFDKSRGVSGRAASRGKQGCRYDHGANYFKIDSDEVGGLIRSELKTDDLVRIGGEVATFDRSGRVEPGDPQQNAVDKWTYRHGISQLGKLMIEAGGLEVMGETPISRIHRRSEGWALQAGDKTFDYFDAVLLTPPGPQAADLLEDSDLGVGRHRAMIDELRKARYHSQFSVIVNFAGNVTFPEDCYALINSDRKHELAWLSLENRKPGHVPAGQSLLVAQMAPDWTHSHFNDPRDAVVLRALAAAGQLLDTNLPEVNWSDTQRWRYAHPYSAADAAALRKASPQGLFFAGDALVGKGRITRSIETGLAAARDICRYLDA